MRDCGNGRYGKGNQAAKTDQEMFFLWKIHFYFVFFRIEKLNTANFDLFDERLE